MPYCAPFNCGDTSFWLYWILKQTPYIADLSNVAATVESFVLHYIDVIMTTTASQITSLTVAYSTVYSDTDHRKHKSSASLAFVWGIHRDRWLPRTKEQLRGKCFHLMTSSCKRTTVSRGISAWQTAHGTWRDDMKSGWLNQTRATINWNS